jgi:hypothetical protein
MCWLVRSLEEGREEIYVSCPLWSVEREERELRWGGFTDRL